MSGMLGAHTAAVKRQMTRPDQHERRLAAPARRRPSRPRRADQGTGGAGPGLGPERAIPRCARSFRITTGSCSVAISGSRPRNAGTPEHRSSSVGRVKSRQLFIAGRRHRPRLAADAVAISPPSVAARWDVPSGSGRRSMPTAGPAQDRRASAPSTLVAAAPAGPTPSRPCGRRRSPCRPDARDAVPAECLGFDHRGRPRGKGLQAFRRGVSPETRGAAKDGV